MRGGRKEGGSAGEHDTAIVEWGPIQRHWLGRGGGGRRAVETGERERERSLQVGPRWQRDRERAVTRGPAAVALARGCVATTG
jgi:hypothetical protein